MNPFSRRSEHDLTENALTRALGAARARGRVLDLTVSNPTTAGIAVLSERGRAALSAPEVGTYEPLPFGLPEARAAIAAGYLSLGAAVDPRTVVCTASTSEAYAWLFALLADVGDEVLVPQPSYPLFSYLAQSQSVVPRPYPLRYDGAWHIDLPELRARITPRTRAIVLVSPNNPTGSYTKTEELEALLDLGVPLVSDEVFARYPLSAPRGIARTVAGGTRGLVFALSGLSKEAALPQLKLGWIVAGGAPALVQTALDRLEVIADTFLSVGAPVLRAAPLLLAEAEHARAAIVARTRANLQALDAALGPDSPATRLHLEGGWYATIRLPSCVDLGPHDLRAPRGVLDPRAVDERFALHLMEREGVYLHPGSFFDFGDGAFVIVSLLTPTATFHEGVLALARHVGAG